MNIPNVSGILPSADDFPGEVVTRAITRDVDLGSISGHGGAGVLALITLDNGHDHTKPNTFGPQGLLSLNAALDAAEARAAAGEIAAVGVTGKPFILAAGADLDGAAAAIAGAGVDPAAARERALGIASLGHAVFRRLGELPVPSFAFINGVALGGGLEVALHCTYRTISSGVPMVAFPECFLGLVPGWGGAYLLPRLIGPARALKLIIENPLSQNKMLRGPEAFELGIADAMFEPADFLEESLRWAAKILSGTETVTRYAGSPAAASSPWRRRRPSRARRWRSGSRSRQAGWVSRMRSAAGPCSSGPVRPSSARTSSSRPTSSRPARCAATTPARCSTPAARRASCSR